VLDRLIQIHPELYANWKCIGCNDFNESTSHIWHCAAYSTIIDEILKATKDHLLDLLRDTTILSSSLIDLLNIFDQTFEVEMRDSSGLSSIMRSIIPNSFVSIVQKITRNRKKCLCIVTNTLTFFFKKMYEEVWKHRCKLMHDKEILMGITKQDKFLQSASKFLPHTTDYQISPVWETWIHLANKYGNKFSDF
jgi:hypothetical protein